MRAADLRHAILVLTLVAGIVREIPAQGYGHPLALQGVEDPSLHSAASRALGGLTIGFANGPSGMFRNPAGLTQLTGLEISLSAVHNARRRSQDQAWFPLRNFPTFSLMMEGLLPLVRDPDLDAFPPDDGIIGPEDSIPRPYDKLGPNWSTTGSETLPLEITAAVPFELAGIRFGVGVGMVQFADLDLVFRNNNVLSPSIGSQRPSTVPLPSIGQEIPVMWSSLEQSRTGSINGFGAALSAEPLKGLSLGVSAMLLSGSSDDAERTQARARIRFGNNNNVYYYLLDSVYSRVSTVGTSDYTGFQVSLSATYANDVISCGVAIQPPTTIERSLSATITVDTTGIPTQSTVQRTEKMTLPWRGTLGFSLKPRDDLRAGLEYEIRPYASAEFQNAGGTVTTPWLSGYVFRAGLEYTPVAWLACRAGYSRQSFTFEQEGSALVGEPAGFPAYSGGIGISIAGAKVDVTYEYSDRNYQDMWQTNVSINRATHSTIITSLSYIIN